MQLDFSEVSESLYYSFTKATLKVTLVLLMHIYLSDYTESCCINKCLIREYSTSLRIL